MKTKNKTYFVHFNYAATGEGAIDSIGVVFEQNKEDAKKQFLYNVMINPDDQSALDYFIPGAVAYDMGKKVDRDKAKEILSIYLSKASVDSIMDAHHNYALQEFTFHVSRNYS